MAYIKLNIDDADGELPSDFKVYVDKAIAFTIDKTAKELSDITHTLPIWKNAARGEIMTFDLLDDFSLESII